MVFGTVVSQRAAAVTPMRFVHIGVDDGLSQGSVDAIVQDAQGFMWIGTSTGLDLADPLTHKVKRYAIDTSRYEPASGDDTAVRALLEVAT
jgi:ligand-binding sensor domain-containing protein